MQHYSWAQDLEVMEQRIDYLVLLLLIYFSSSTIEARKHLKYSISDTNGNYIGSPYYVPPYEDVMGPSSSPNNQEPLYCVYPPPTPLPPSTTFPTPTLPLQSPPPPFISTTPPILTPTPPRSTSPTPSPTSSPSPPLLTPGPPSYEPSPPLFTPGPPSYEPSPPGSVLSPPLFTPGPPSYEPSPPGSVPSPPLFMPGPPSYEPSPPEFVPGPPVFLPPVVYPPPAAPPPPRPGTGPGLWCVAKPTVPDPIIQEAMTYACGSGADCDLIQPNGACYQPDTLIAHASFAFNSYWQRTKVAGGTCDFGGTAMLITKDPSYDGCQFVYS